MKKAKKIKSFTVDEETYDYLVKALKESDSEYSISSLVNDYLGYLQYSLKTVQDGIKAQKKEVSKAWLVNHIINDSRWFPPDMSIIQMHPDLLEDMQREIEAKVSSVLADYEDEKESILKRMFKKVIG